MANSIRPHLLSSLAMVALFSAAAMAAPAPQGMGQAQPQPKDAAPHPLAWAYAVFDPMPPEPVPDDPTPRHIPGSDQGFTMKQLRDNANVFDWFPNDHPPMPTIVMHRRSPGLNPWIGGCGWCHLPNGKGRPENAGIAGLPEDYILMQLSDCKNGARKTGDPGLTH